MGRHSTAIAPEASVVVAEVKVLTPPQSPTKKRKRDASLAAEIEVDITAPEPPSKKALRKAKKERSNSKTTPSDSSNPLAQDLEERADPGTSGAEKPSNRSDNGIWIGNLSWTTTKTELRDFFVRNMLDDGASITRLHLPPPSQTTLMNNRQKIKPQNKGFAYIDFSTSEALADALSLSEKLFSGRKVLIKDSKSFEGRPEPSKEPAVEAHAGKPPSKRIFVGNLGFDTTKDELREHFGRCGEVADVFLTTFEDSGKCKGYGWVTFEELDAAQAAVRGWTELAQDAEEDEEDEEDAEEGEGAGIEEVKPKKKVKPRKWWVNRLQGRPLRMEFAEDKAVRYKKRYGKGGMAQKGDASEGGIEGTSAPEDGIEGSKQPPRAFKGRDMGRRPLGRKVDARTIKPGAALAAAPRLTGAIVESKGKKTAFE